MPKYKCTVTVSVTTVKEVTEVIEIDAPDEVTAEEDARTAAELIDEDTWDTNPNQSDSYIEGFDVDDIEIEELKESLKEDDEIDDYNQYIKRTTSKDFQDSEKNNDSDSQLLKEGDNFELEKKIEDNEIIFNKIKDCVTKKPPDFNQAYKIFFENNSDEFSSKILNLENLGKIYLKIAEKKNTILITEAERLHKTAFELCQKGGRYDYGSSYTLARFYIEGIGTKQSFIKGQDTLLISYHGMPENTDKEKELKGSRALQISNTFQKKDPDGWKIYEEAKEDLKTAKTWILRAKELGRIYKIDEKIEELEQKISFQKTNQDSQKNYESNKKTNINKNIVNSQIHSNKIDYKKNQSQSFNSTAELIQSIEDKEGVTIELIKSILRKGNFQYRETQGFIQDCLKMRKGGFFKKHQPAPTMDELRSLYIQYNPRIESQFPGHSNIIFSKEIIEYLGFVVDQNNQVYKK